MQSLLHSDVFPHDLPKGLPSQRFMQHMLDVVQGVKPICRPAYRVRVIEACEVDHQLSDYLKRGFLHSSSLSWASPIWIFIKKDGSMRLCVDSHGLHAIMIKNHYDTYV